MNLDVAVVGDINVDILTSISTLPKKEEEVSLKKLHLAPGGNACLSSLACRKLGLSTGFVGKIGRDPFGGFLLDVLQDEKVDIGGLKIVPNGQTGATVAFVYPDSKRSFLSYKGVTATLSPRDLDWSYISQAKVFFLAGFYHCTSLRKEGAELFKEAKRRGMITAIDTSFDTEDRWEDVYPLLKHTDIFFLGCEREGVTGEKAPMSAGSFLLERGVKTACVKMGEKGSIIMDKEKGCEEIPPFEVESVDGTGCGDAFNAGFLLGQKNGKTLRESGIMGNAIGALVSTKYGGHAALPNMHQLNFFLEEQLK